MFEVLQDEECQELSTWLPSSFINNRQHHSIYHFNNKGFPAALAHPRPSLPPGDKAVEP